MGYFELMCEQRLLFVVGRRGGGGRVGQRFGRQKVILHLGRSSPGREAGVFDWLLPVYLHLSEQLERTRKSGRKLERQEILAEETSLFFLP